MVVHSQVVVIPGVGADEKECRLSLAPLVPTRRLPRPNGQKQPIGQRTLCLAGTPVCSEHGLENAGTSEHISGHREVSAVVAAAPRDTVRGGAEEAPAGSDSMHVPDVEVGVVLRERLQRGTDWHALLQEGHPPPADIRAHVGLGSDTTRRRDERDQRPDGPGRAVATATPKAPTSESCAAMENVKRSGIATTLIRSQ